MRKMNSGLKNSKIEPKLKQIRNFQLFFKYLLSYIVILIIPVMGLSFLVSNYFLTTFEKEVVNNSINILAHVQNSIDTSIKELHTISNQIYNNPELTTYKVQNNVLNTKDGIKELKKYIIGHDFIKEVYVYYLKTGKICSSTNYLNVSDFFRMNKFEKWNQEEFLNDLNKINKNTFRPAENVDINENYHGRFITYLVPDTGASGRIVFFLIDEKKIIDMLKNFRGNTIIFDKDYNVFASLYYEEYLVDWSIGTLPLSPESNGSTEITIDGVNYFVSYFKSESTGFTYVTMTPVGEVLNSVITIKSVFMYGMLAAMLISFGLIAFSMKLNYNPIKQLKKFAEEKAGGKLGNINEIEAVKLTIEQISKNRESLDMKVKGSIFAVKELLLRNLLKGSFYDIRDFNEKGRDINVHFNNGYYQVAVVLFSGIIPKNRDNAEEIIGAIEKCIPDDFQGYAKDTMENGKIILILSVPDANISEEKQNVYYTIQNLLLDNYGVNSTIGIGRIYQNPVDIGKSYIEAVTALDYRLVKGKNRVILFDEVSINTAFINEYPVSKLKSLEVFILEGDITKITGIVNEITDLIKKPDMSLFSVRCLCYDIINTIIKSMYAANNEYPDVSQNYPDVLSLTNFDTVEELVAIIKDFTTDICTLIKEREEMNNENLLNEIIRYIEKNYNDSNFSIQIMSDHFKMSLSDLSRYFKQKTGQNISDYVTYLRIKKAKELLLASNDPLDKIVKSIGYYDTSSFIQKFKKIVGYTPGAFRKYNK